MELFEETLALLFAHLLDAVVAIGTKDSQGRMRWVASGFLYGNFTQQKDENQQKLYNTYLVSNRHVFEGLDPAFIRVNLPSPFTKALNIKEGDLVIITLNDSQMVL